MAFVELLAVPEIGAVVIAMLAIIVLAGLYLIIELFAGWFGKIPVIGPMIEPYIQDAAHAMRDASLAVWHGVLWALTHTLQAFVWMYRNMMRGIARVIDDIINAIEHQAYVVIPRQEAKLREFTVKRSAEALHTALEYGRYVLKQAQSYLQQAKNYADHVANYAYVKALSALQAARQQLHAEIATAEHQATSQFQAAEQLAQQLHAQAEHDLQAGDQAAIVAGAQRAIAWINADAAAAASSIWAGIGTQVQGIETVMGNDFADVQKLLRQIPTQAPADLAAVVAAGLAIVPPVLALQADCTVPTCRDLGPARQLAHLLADAGTMAALLAWMIYCITEPGAAASDTVAVADPIAVAVMDPLLSLLRVA